MSGRSSGFRRRPVHARACLTLPISTLQEIDAAVWGAPRGGAAQRGPGAAGICIALPAPLLGAVDELVARGVFQSRSAAVQRGAELAVQLLADARTPGAVSSRGEFVRLALLLLLAHQARAGSGGVEEVDEAGAR